LEKIGEPGYFGVVVMELGTILRFDDSLSAFVVALVGWLGSTTVEQGRVLRDAEGRLSFIAGSQLDSSLRQQLSEDLTKRIGPYVRGGGRAVLDPESPGAELFLSDPRTTVETITPGDGAPLRVRLLDRRIVGSDWLTPPEQVWTDPPGRMVFASLKGGVGRTTALAVLAVDLSRTGQRVLVVDLDLEAPGLGEILIDPADRSRYGALDWYVEAGLSEIDDPFLDDLVAPSRLRIGNGLIDVVPAVGTVSDTYPANVLAKLSRAYLGSSGDAGPSTFLEQTRLLIDRLAERRSYDAILVDARAGLNETTAAAMLGLGADVLLFGLDAPQTFPANRFLLAHLGRFSRDTDDWLSRLKVVHAKASADEEDQKRFRDRNFDVFDELLYRDVPLVDEADQDPEGVTQPEFSLDDRDAPHYAWVVLSDANYTRFDPLAEPRLVGEGFYRRTFDHFLTQARERMGLTEARP
jgi:hypothetical protein